MEDRGLIHRIGERIKEHPAETAWIALGAAALTYEVAAPDKSKDLLSHAADRHQVIAALGTFVLGTHLTNVWERLGLENWDVLSQIGKQFTRGVHGE